MPVIPGNAQHRGKREQQQDSFGFSDIEDTNFVKHGGVLAVLADGMGGISYGKDAGKLAVKTILNSYSGKNVADSVHQSLYRAVIEANENIYNLSEQMNIPGNIGTTLIAVVIWSNQLYWISVGDSRIYLLRNNQLTQLTTDHIYKRKLLRDVADDKITKTEADNHPERNSLTSYLGLPEVTEIDQNVKPLLLCNKDRVVLCSDGLYRSLTVDDITNTYNESPQLTAEMLVELTLQRNLSNQDNASVVIMEYLDKKPSILKRIPKWFGF
ncbi:serine/threonine protein phosphatase [Candidatus Magnetobacterium bavaricum]|uniref:Serine/threonine protein phosphatase n=1 Tax=Candidatus Magnetobacterium bavaricum TaxID=29290 RepID=A0A0F3GRE0_9BACT|nr:serine/threonine protein phosphatase [Candidatus Magnetobacterium bavaricum]